MDLRPIARLRGEIEVPGDKSISHRYALLAAIAEGTSRLANYSTGQDCASTLSCLQSLGVLASRRDKVWEIMGRGLRGLHRCESVLDAGNSGSTIRMLSGILAGQPFESRIDGDDSLRRRPMGRILEPLRQMGADVEANEDRFPPLRIAGSKLRGIEYHVPVASAQVKSCVLLAGLHASGMTEVSEPHATRNHTELALELFGARVEVEENRVRVEGDQRLRPVEASVPGDFSSAVFVIGAGCLIRGSDVIIHNIGYNPTRRFFVDMLIAAGAGIDVLRTGALQGEPIADLRIRHSDALWSSFPRKIGHEEVVQMIDELPMLAVLAVRSRNGVEITGAKELRVKESDRITAVSENLQRMGIRFEELEDGWRIEGEQSPHGADLKSFGDHRIAMAFSVAAWSAAGASQIDDTQCVSISFPEFFDLFGYLNR
ncbi:MAG: 3-phosphoshikimate 1-carboxyvinyltransferase [Acidobacteriota bacterium]